MSQSENAIRVLHVIDDFSTTNTGVAATVSQLSGWQAERFHWVGVCTSGAVDIPTPQGVQVISSPIHTWMPRWRYPAKGLQNFLEILREHQVTHLHVHGVWQAGFVLGMLAAVLYRLPVVLSVHGMWTPAALGYGGRCRQLKKLLYWKLFARWLMLRRVGLHAITPLEAQQIREYAGRRANITLPNAIAVPHSAVQQPIVHIGPLRQVVYLGRLHPIKGPDLLIKAFSESELSIEWELIIAGPEEVPRYANELKAQAAGSKKSSQIRFVGPCYGAIKNELLAGAWVVVVPSHSEVVGMVNLEAASLCTPSITTHATGLRNWEAGGGVLSEATSEGLRLALNAAMQWSTEERIDRGRRVRRMVEKEFSLESVGAAWSRFYCDLNRQLNP